MDIVYILKNGVSPDELRYSLRSICKNFTFDRVWFAGGKPEGIEPDCYLEINQEGRNRYAKASNTIRQVCETEEVSDDFWLFNDDFFIMKKISTIRPAVKGTIGHRIQEIQTKHSGATSEYARQLQFTIQELKARGYERLDYALHIPMAVNKEMALEVMDVFPGLPMFRCLYGNYWHLAEEVRPDVKVFGDEDFPKTSALLSTNNESFRNGRVGEYIRNKFKTPCKYEKEVK